MTLRERFQIQKEACKTATPSFYHARKESLAALVKSVKQYQAELCRAVNEDFTHRAKHETQLLEIFSTIKSIQYTLKHLHDWMRLAKANLPWWFMFGRAEVIPQPKGVVGIIVPWNYPIHLSLVPLVSAIAAGNRVMLKMSSLTPKTSLAIEKVLNDVFAMQEAQVIHGGPNISEEFVKLPFDHLFFTGSVESGKKVLVEASHHLIPVTLELGGKSPVLIADNFAIETAVERIMTGKLINAGQTCVAPDYVLMQKGAPELFVEMAKEFVKKHYPKIATNSNYSSIINHEHFKRLTDLLEDATSQGAEVIPLCEDKKAKEENKFIPHIVLNATDKMRVLKEEIFGPILPVLTYQDFSDAIDYVRNRPSPLALYIFDDNNRRVNDIIDTVPSGGVTVNDTLLHTGIEELPFGGIGQSGMGQYHGKAGFDTFTHYRSVFYQSQVNFLGMARPPFGKAIRWFIRRKLK